MATNTQTKQLYHPNEQDYDYFMEHYDKKGLFSNKSLWNVTYEEFKQETLNYQKQRIEWAMKHDCLDTLAPFENFDSISRELVRDQLLWVLGYEPIGAVFAPFGEYASRGIEHVSQQTIKSFLLF